MLSDQILHCRDFLSENALILQREIRRWPQSERKGLNRKKQLRPTKENIEINLTFKLLILSIE